MSRLRRLRPASRFRGDELAERFFLIGPSGSGKSALSEMVSEQVRIRRFDTDAMIIGSLGVTTIAEVFDREGELAFRKHEQQAIQEVEESSVSCIVATGGGLPAIPGMMERLGTLGITIYLRASVDTLWKRLSMDPNSLRDRPLLRAGGKLQLQQLIDQRMAVYQSAAITYDTDRLSAEKVREFLVDVVNSYR